MGYTKATRAGEIKRKWHLIDVKNKVLGRISTDIAQKLIGKSKPYYVGHLDVGDYVVVINAKNIKVTGKKEEKKIYTRYSGYPGGLKEEKLGDLRKRKPEKIIRHSVSGMLPKNKLRRRRLKRLFIFTGAKHKYEKKFK